MIPFAGDGATGTMRAEEDMESMSTMVIELPNDRPVHLIVGSPGFAMAEERVKILDAHPTTTRRKHRPMLMLLGGVAVLGFGFVLGRHEITPHAQAVAQAATAPNSASPPMVQALPQPGSPVPSPITPPAAQDAQVPAALTQQLAQPPQVLPPPGAPPASGQPKQNPFGLDD